MRDGHDIVLHIYEPTPPTPPTRQPISGPTQTTSSSLRPCVINFHGGGFTIGSGTDDSRWAHWCTRTSGPSTTGHTSEASETRGNTISRPRKKGKGLGAIFISIEYRLSPEYPHPTPVNDCIDSTLYILNNAEEFGIDKNQVFLSGFSAGGSLAVTTALALSPSSSSFAPLDSSHTSLPNSNTTTTTTTTTTKTKDQIAGVIAFYPVLDFHTPRSIKRQRARTYANSNSNFGGKVTPLPGWMTRMFDTSYLPPDLLLDRMDPMISPGLAPDLGGFPNAHLILCGADVLANEGREFGERLRKREREESGDGSEGREVVIRTVPGARHGWDKPPLPLQGSVGEEYDAAIESMMRWGR